MLKFVPRRANERLAVRKDRTTNITDMCYSYGSNMFQLALQRSRCLCSDFLMRRYIVLIYSRLVFFIFPLELRLMEILN